MTITLKNILFGICLGSAIFAISGIVFDVLNSGSFELTGWSYTRMALGAMIVGIGFSVPSRIYDNEKLSFGMQAVIHMSIGCTVYLIVAFLVGWIPVSAGWAACILAIAGQLLAAFLIWIGFARYYKQVARKMTAKIQERQQ